jgi:trk system potassium uptake protein TrkA
VVDKPQSIELGKQLNITATLAPRILAANQVMAFVHGGNVNRVALIAEGQAEIIEFQATAGLSILGKPFSELDLPRGIIVAALIRGPKALIPGGGDEIREGDSVVLFSLQERIGYVEALLKQNSSSQPKHTQAVEQE